MENIKECPFCAEIINSKAFVCKYCKSIVGGGSVKSGTPVKVRLKSHDKVYSGEIFVPQHMERVSDVINDNRHFIVLSNAKEETKTSEINIGVLAINKNIIEWVRFMGNS